MEASLYSAVETLRDGRRLEIRALKPEDRAGLLAAAGRTSGESLARRFFAPKRGFSEKEIEFYTNVDFERHVALVALVEEAGRPLLVGAARYIVAQPGRAEVAFAVEDAHQGRGIGPALLRHLAKIARGAGLEELTAEVLPDNAPMLKVFERSSLALTKKRSQGVVHVVMRLSA
jgi:RimJ/RimL family protein N-acetyltransferase